MTIKLKYDLYEKSNNEQKKTAIPKNRLFFRKYDDICYPLKSHIAYMYQNNIQEMDLWLAERETLVPNFFCKHYEEVGEKGNCGQICEGYKPRNGKSGVCKHYGYTYWASDKCFTLKLKVL